MAGSGLNVPCKVRFKLFTLDDSLIVRKLGRLSKVCDGEAGQVKKQQWDRLWRATDNCPANIFYRRMVCRVHSGVFGCGSLLFR